jgi:hypothetical protein
MTLASNIVAAWTNIALNATLTASSEAASMLVTKLQQEDTKRNWRTGAAIFAQIFVDLGSVKSWDTFALFNTNLLADGFYRLRASVADPLCVTNVYDTGTITGAVDPNYKDLIALASSPIATARYLRLDINQPTVATYIEAGFLFIGLRTQFDYNYSWGDGRTRVDPSIFAKTKGGQTKIKIRPPFWQWEIPMGWITEVQKNGVVEQISLLNGRRLPVLFIMNPASTNLGRDSIFGLIQDSFPVVSLQTFDSAGGIMSSASLKVEQRL